MKCSVTELEIESIYRRISEADLNLSPDFQRGEVWSISKKKKLIDSILRGWRIPPIHLIENKEYIDEVLDGQQRLATIRDFIENTFSIDGSLKPEDSYIQDLNSLYFEQLDPHIQRKFKKYSLTVIRLTEFSPEEPSELFFRLNQPSTLTSAEQRNSYIGDTRNQIKDLVVYFEQLGANKENIGFSNSRMAYDDVISKFCYILEMKSVKKKVTSASISEKYRNNEPFDDEVISEVQSTLKFFIESSKQGKLNFQSSKIYINKATLFSWLIFSYRNKDFLSLKKMGELIYIFEFARDLVKGKIKDIFVIEQGYEKVVELFDKNPLITQLLLIFNQRASMGSTDVNSIIYRDIILEMFLIIYFDDIEDNLEFRNYISHTQTIGNVLETIATDFDWGDL